MEARRKILVLLSHLTSFPACLLARPKPQMNVFHSLIEQFQDKKFINMSSKSTFKGSYFRIKTKRDSNVKLINTG